MTTQNIIQISTYYYFIIRLIECVQTSAVGVSFAFFFSLFQQTIFPVCTTIEPTLGMTGGVTVDSSAIL